MRFSSECYSFSSCLLTNSETEDFHTVFDFPYSYRNKRSFIILFVGDLVRVNKPKSKVIVAGTFFKRTKDCRNSQQTSARLSISIQPFHFCAVGCLPSKTTTLSLRSFCDRSPTLFNATLRGAKQRQNQHQRKRTMQFGIRL